MTETREPPEYFGALLAAKLNPPQPSPVSLPRNTLFDRICESSGRLILVHAPAGFGKTTLLLQSCTQLRTRGVRTGWLTLDTADNDAARFMMFFAAAFERLLCDHEAMPQHSIFAVARSLGGLIVELIERIRAVDVPFALFLDDFEHVQNPAVLGLLGELLRHIPAHGRLVLGSRYVPELGLGRLRAKGELLELGPDELRFTLADTRELITRRAGRVVDDDVIPRLHDHTEGWPAALWIATLALQKSANLQSFITGFSGSSTEIATYLAEDVLGHLDAATRDFLLHTSILGTLNAQICDAVLDIDDSQRRLSDLQRANLFLIPIDNESREYRYHALFAQFLKTQLERQQPAIGQRLHRRAAQWYESQKQPVAAIEHAFASGDLDVALGLLDQHAEHLLTELRLRLLTRWLDPLPTTALAAHPRLRAIHVWAILNTRGAREAMLAYQALQAERHPDPALAAHLLALGPGILAVADRIEEAYALGTANRALLSREHGFAYVHLTNVIAHAAFVNDNYDESLDRVEEVRRAQGMHGDKFNLIFSEATEGHIDLMHARLRQATSRYRFAAELRAPEARFSMNRNIIGNIPLAEALYEMDAREESQQLLQVYVPLVKEIGLADQLIVGHITLSRLLHLQGDAVRGLQLLAELEQCGHAASLPRAVASARIERARLAILRGDGAAADVELQRAAAMECSRDMDRLSMPANDVDTTTIGRLRWMIHSGVAQTAIPMLRQQIKNAESRQRLRRALKLRILLALALHAHKDARAAMATMREVLALMCSEGFVRIFADEGASAAKLLGDYLAQHPAAQCPDLSADYLVRLKTACGFDATPPVLPEAAPMETFEALTTTEIKVLNLLADGHTNQAMAERLFVSETTVRTHLRNINAKFNAQSRTHAVAIGRRLGLVR